MSVLNEHARAALMAGHLAHLATLNPDGAPHITVVLTGVDDGEIVVAHLGAGQKLGNVQRDPRVALSMVTGDRTELGLEHYLVIRGRARVTEGGGPELLKSLADRYLGLDVPVPPTSGAAGGHVIRISPDQVLGIGPWRD